jgi:hypothetical protein
MDIFDFRRQGQSNRRAPSVSGGCLERFKQDSDPDQVIDEPLEAFRQPLRPLEEHPLGFCFRAFTEIGLDLFNQASDFRRWYFEG